jgi:hypothetical protein
VSNSRGNPQLDSSNLKAFEEVAAKVSNDEGTELQEDDFAEELVGYSVEFDELTMQRHRLGAEKYGPGKFLTTDTIEEALYELADLANYARYSYIKLRHLQEVVLRQVNDLPGPTGFIPASNAVRMEKGL